jgi:glycosyltransferase involved in cell wall biosynthesis
VEDASGIDDAVLGCLYRLAHCTLFPSLSEGYGMPVAESLTAGTPVITSGFGSMAEIAADGGALTIDPRDDDALTDAWDRLLTDPVLHARLRAEALARPFRSWAEYGDEVWTALTAD